MTEAAGLGSVQEGHLPDSGRLLGQSGPHNALSARGIDIEVRCGRRSLPRPAIAAETSC